MENNEKVFINICQSHGIPAPEDISVEQLTEILASETPSTYKIPMSITQLRITKDKASKDAIVCDVAIHPDFFRTIELNNIFRDFLITIVFEALDTKYNLQINRDTWIILKNRKCIGNLEKHRVQNRDAVKVYESYQNPTKEHKSKIKELSGDNEKSEEHKSPLIKEIKMNAIQKIENKNQGDGVTVVPDTAKTFTAAENKEPQHRLFKTVDNMENGLLVAEFFLPDIAMQNEINLELNKDRILLEARRSGYLFESFLPNNVDDEKSDAEFNMNTRVCVQFC